jgi:hypothetical protein
VLLVEDLGPKVEGRRSRTCPIATTSGESVAATVRVVVDVVLPLPVSAILDPPETESGLVEENSCLNALTIAFAKAVILNIFSPKWWSCSHGSVHSKNP